MHARYTIALVCGRRIMVGITVCMLTMCVSACVHATVEETDVAS